MKKKLLPLLLVLTLCVGFLPAPASAAGSDLPEWNFLFIFAPLDADFVEDGTTKHAKTAISAEEEAILTAQAEEFAAVMEESGVMKAHCTFWTLTKPITQLSNSSYGAWPNLTNIADYLAEQQLSLDEFDHLVVFARTDGIKRGYMGLTNASTTFASGTTYSFIPADSSLRDWGSTPKRPVYVILHEFLHTMELTCRYSFDLHAIEDDCVPGYISDKLYKACMLDIILNRIKGEHGSGVRPSAWKYSMRALRNIRDFTIPDDMDTIEKQQFKSYTNLERVVIPDTVTSIKDHAFQFCSNLASVTLPNSLSVIEEGVFEQCTSLTEITIPSGVTTIELWAFAGCSSLRKVTIPDSVTSIQDHAFRVCSSLSSVTLPKNLSVIEEGVFEQCTSLTEITIPSGVTTIGPWAFANCPLLREVTIPASVTSIGDDAFRNANIKDVYFGGTRSQWNAIQMGINNSALPNATIHFNGNGALGDHQELEWEYDPSLGQVTVTGSEVSPAEPVYVAVYDENDRMTGLRAITASGKTAAVGNNFAWLQLIWADETSAPKCASVRILP